MKTTGSGVNTCRNRSFLGAAALRRGCDFGMVPADFRSPVLGRAGLLFVRRPRSAAVAWGHLQDLRQLQ